MLALGRPPEVRYKPVDGVSPRLQRVLDALEISPAIIKTATWDVVGWNRAAAAIFTDYAKLPRDQRNILRLMFADAGIRAKQEDWQSVARFVVGAFRADATRAGANAEITKLVEELSRASPEFEALWRDNDIAAPGEGLKRLRHAELGMLELEFSAFAVDGRPELGMVIYNPASKGVADRIRNYLQRAGELEGSASSSGWVQRHE